MNASRGVLRRRIAVGIVIAVLAIAALRDFGRLGDALPWKTMDDFPDFYCAGKAIDRGASPYTYEPLRTCEHRVNAGNTFRGRLFAANPSIAVPAPQPPYDFAPFTTLARLPFGVARIIDAAAILVAVALCAVALVPLGVPLELALAALALSTGYAELNTGQLVPFALLALTLCGLLLSRGRDAYAGVLAALTAIEPTAGVPVIIATLAFVPRARASVIATIVVLAFGSFAIVGPRALLDYVTGVLPAHAGSELHFPFQYSLTYVLAAAGASPAVAQLGGAISYIVFMVAGLVLAPRVSAALRHRELLVFIPALCAVIAGPFVHQEELCFALPALLIFTIGARGPQRAVAALALCLLAIPWIAVWGTKQLFLASLFVCAVILLRAGIELPIGAVALCAIAALVYIFELHPPSLPVPHAGAESIYARNALVQNEWRDYTQARSTRDPLWLAIKLPSWAALLAALVIACSNSRLPPASDANLESSRERRDRQPGLPRARTD
jgi:hypothetical protein